MSSSLTPEQRELWSRAYPDGVVRPSGDQTQAQAENLAVADFRYACRLGGLEPVPSEEAIRAVIANPSLARRPRMPATRRR